MTVTIDGAGRVVIPQAVRRRLGLTAGTELEIDEVDGGVVLRPAPVVHVETADDGLPVLQAPADTPTMTDDDVRRLIDEGREWRAS